MSLLTGKISTWILLSKAYPRITQNMAGARNIMLNFVQPKNVPGKKNCISGEIQSLQKNI